ALTPSFTFISLSPTIEPGEIAESAAEDLYLVEEIERFEPRKHVALQAETERHHRHDHGDANDDAHRRQNRAQLCLPQISKREMENVEEAHGSALCFVLGALFRSHNNKALRTKIQDQKTLLTVSTDRKSTRL